MEKGVMKTAKQKKTLTFAELPKDYTGLCRTLLPRPIRTLEECDEAYELASLMAGHSLTADQEDYLEALSTFIAQFEETNQPKTDNLPGHEVLRFLCQENELSGADLGRLLNVDRTMASRILRGERNLTLSHIRTLCRQFNLSAECFVTE
jgi:HTH-type transcriptional regulator/antitoxin HigA